MWSMPCCHERVIAEANYFRTQITRTTDAQASGDPPAASTRTVSAFTSAARGPTVAFVTPVASAGFSNATPTNLRVSGSGWREADFLRCWKAAIQGLSEGSMRGWNVQPLALLAFIALSQPSAAMDHLVDGVPLPLDAKMASTAESEPAAQRQWAGAWVGAWGGTLKHILLVESVADDGLASVIYAIGDNPSFGIRRQWSRQKATVSGRTLEITGASFSATYDLMDGRALKATYTRGNTISQATMMRTDFAELTKPGTVVEWTRGKSELLPTDLIEDGKPVRLEVVIFKPSGDGPFPLAVINHGSTGRGANPAIFTETWFDVGLADILNERGWIVAFPQRRGRGKSDGLYDEGFAASREMGYTCESEISLRGANRALGDIEAAISALRRRHEVTRSRILIGGQSRGGVLAVAYAGAHPDQILGVINFVGGWIAEGCPTAKIINETLFRQGAHYDRPTLWLYGNSDRFYSMAHSRTNFAAFENSGGHGTFLEFDVPGDNGHRLMLHPKLWSAPVENYLGSLTPAEGK
jgi:dienelactone hydrolase